MSCSSLRNRGLRQLGNDLLRNPCLKLGFLGSPILKHPRSVTAPMLLSFFVANYRYLKTNLGDKSAPKELKPCSCIERGIGTHKIPTWLLFLYPTITLPGPLFRQFPMKLVHLVHVTEDKNAMRHVQWVHPATRPQPNEYVSWSDPTWRQKNVWS